MNTSLRNISTSHLHTHITTLSSAHLQNISNATSTTSSDLFSGKVRSNGRVKMGKDYSGTGDFLLSLSILPVSLSPVTKYFSFDKSVAAAQMIPNDYKALFRAYVSRGEMMEFCWGKRDTDGIGCCGGRIHNEEKQMSLVAFRQVGAALTNNSISASSSCNAPYVILELGARITRLHITI
ncbi:hypothetical protein C8J56DRAFT_906347 [Mycena floridula]|nr:hypothetical protein C8J56DRAFT_906347 [Mycena floridula]